MLVIGSAWLSLYSCNADDNKLNLMSYVSKYPSTVPTNKQKKSLLDKLKQYPRSLPMLHFIDISLHLISCTPKTDSDVT